MEALENPFPITSGVVIHPGIYHFNKTDIIAQSDMSKKFYVSAQARTGEFWNGVQNNWRWEWGYRFGPQESIAFYYEHNNINLPAGDFDAELFNFRFNYSFTPNFYVRTLIQYNSQNRQFSTNFRLNLIHGRESDIFLIYNNRYNVTNDRYDPLLRQIVLKFTYNLGI